MGLFFFWAAVIACFSIPDSLALLPPVSDEQIKTAAKDPEWLRMLHYRKTKFGHYESDAELDPFFISPHGQRDPAAELRESIAAFSDSSRQVKYPQYADETIGPEDRHPQCVFPARYAWVKERFKLQPDREMKCQRYQRWKKQLDAQSVSLVFASAYLGNPASSFGHTFLKINSRHRANAAEDLLNYGVNYAAVTAVEGGMLYAVSGIFGGYAGAFSLLPFHTKVQEYAQAEQRDLWEYPMMLSPSEVERFVTHLWELGTFASYYYFFKRNCSREILALIEYVRPSIDFVERLWPWVIPSETLRIMAKQPKLLGPPIYRPSLASQLQTRYALMNDLEKGAFRKLTSATGTLQTAELDALVASSRAFVLESAAEYLQYRKKTNENKLSPGDTKLQHEVLAARSKLPALPPEKQRALEQAPPQSEQPDKGHDIFRLALGVGVTNGGVYEHIDIRPAYHDLLANETGYNRDLELEIPRARVRYYNRTKKLKLESIEIARVTSISPRERFLRSPSWRGGFGFDTRRDIDCGFCNYFRTNVGLGVASEPETGIVYYGFADANLHISGRFDHSFRIGPSVTLGSIISVRRVWKINPSAAVFWFPYFSETSWYQEIRLNQNFSVAPHWEIRAEAGYFREYLDGQLGLAHYF